MQETRSRYADGCHDCSRLLIRLDCGSADIGTTNRQDTIYSSPQETQKSWLILQFLDLCHKVLSVDEPDFSHDDEPIDCNHDSEGRDSGREMWREQRLNSSQRLL